MKKLMFFYAIFMTCALAGTAQDAQDLSKITAAVHQFAKAADMQDASQLDKILHPQFRAVVHRAFGAADASLMDKASYIQLIDAKKIGGDSREVTLLHTDLGQNTASVKAIFRGKALKFSTFISLLKLENGEWQIVGDMPEIEKV